MENWADVLEYEGVYEVSDQGRVRRVESGQIRVPGKRREGYLIVNLSKEGKTTTKIIHRLVAQAFIPNSYDKPEVNHKNGIKTDNRADNLEWATIAENAIHAFENGLRVSVVGSENGQSKLTEKDIPEIFDLRSQGFTHSAIAQQFGVSRSLIGWVLAKKGWNHVA